MPTPKEIDQSKLAAVSPADFLVQKEFSHKPLDLVIVRQLLEALPQDRQPTRTQIQSMIEAVARPDLLGKIIQSIVSDPEQIEHVSRNAFGHSTGMERIELACVGEYSLRVHFWVPEKGETLTEDPHNHTYNFGSKVLSGVLVTDLFKPGEEGANMNMFQISSQNSEQKPKPEVVGESKLQPISPPEGIFLTGNGQAYTMSHSIIHRVRLEHADPIITINLRGGPVKDKSTFFRDGSMPAADPIPKQIDVERRLKELQRIISRRV